MRVGEGKIPKTHTNKRAWSHTTTGKERDKHTGGADEASSQNVQLKIRNSEIKWLSGHSSLASPLQFLTIASGVVT